MNSLDDFNNVVVNFYTSRVIFESDKCFSLDELNKIVSSVEDEAYLTLNEENSKEYHLSVLIVAILLSLVAYIFKTPKWLSYSLYIISYVLLLYKIAFSGCYTAHFLKILLCFHTFWHNLPDNSGPYNSCLSHFYNLCHLDWN